MGQGFIFSIKLFA